MRPHSAVVLCSGITFGGVLGIEPSLAMCKASAFLSEPKSLNFSIHIPFLPEKYRVEESYQKRLYIYSAEDPEFFFVYWMFRNTSLLPDLFLLSLSVHSVATGFLFCFCFCHGQWVSGLTPCSPPNDQTFHSLGIMYDIGDKPRSVIYKANVLPAITIRELVLLFWPSV